MVGSVCLSYKNQRYHTYSLCIANITGRVNVNVDLLVLFDVVHEMCISNHTEYNNMLYSRSPT